MTQTQQQAFDKIIGLRHMSRTSGLLTKRSQNTVLGLLPDEDLAIVCKELLTHEQQEGW